MINKFEVVINKDSFIDENDELGRFGDIYVKINDYNFPSEVWTDFGRDIVYWWMESFIELLSNKEKRVSCGFMDGNYRFDLISETVDLWKVQCIRESSDSEEIWNESTIDVKQAVNSLIKIAEEFKNLLETAGETLSASNYSMRINQLLKFL